MEQNGLLPPQSSDLEKVVLGAVMLERDAINVVIEILTPQSFYNDKHGRIFGAVLELRKRNEPIDILTVTQELSRTNQLNLIGAWYITELTDRVASASNIEYHARIIQQKYIQRELIRQSTIIINKAYQDDADVFDLLGEVESGLIAIKSGIQVGKTESTKDIVDRTIKAIEEAKNNQGILGPSIGLKALDDILMGLRLATVYVIAGKAAMGKSALMNCIAKSLALKHNLRVGVFSLEMPSVQLVRRLLSDLAEIDNRTLASGILTDKQRARLYEVKNLIDERFVIDDTPAITIQYLESKIKKLSAEGVKYFIIDYLQLMTLTAADAKGKLEEAQISFITRNIKKIAKKYDVCIIELAQLNRGDKTRANHRPVISDLKGSSAIEQDADVIIMIHRPEYYNELEINGKSTKGMAEMIIVKHRDGATDSVLVKYIGWLTRFEDLEEVNNNNIQEQTQVHF